MQDRARDFENVPVVSGQMMKDRAVEAIAAGQAMQQVRAPYTTAVAVQKPRSLSQMVSAVLAEAEQAGSSFYYRWEVENRKTGNKTEVIGGSIDLAASIFRSYGNCAMDLQCNETPSHYFFTATMIDLESGMSWPRMFRQRKSQALGRFDQDRQEDIVFQIGQSKAMRNAVLSVMPRWVVEKAIETARQAEINRLTGKGNIELARGEMLRYFAKLGVTKERIEVRLGKPIDETAPEDIADLRALAGAIKDRMTTVGEAFPTMEKEEKTADETPTKPPAPEKPVPAEQPIEPEEGPAEAPPEPAPPVAAEPAAVDGSNPFNDRPAWSGFHSKKDGLSSYYFKNRKAWGMASDDAKWAFAEKWKRCYPDTSFPGAMPLPTQPKAEGPAELERNAKIMEIREIFGLETIKQAKKSMQFATADGVWPPSLDGVNALYEKCAELER